MADLKKKFHGLKKVALVRQRFSLPAKAGEARGVALGDGSKKLAEYGLTGAPGADTLQFKDLGPQVRLCWQRVDAMYRVPCVLLARMRMHPHG